MNILLISSSTRKGRQTHNVALYLLKQLQKHNICTGILDLAEVQFPLFQERYVDMANPKALYKDIFNTMGHHDACIFLTPEYNSSMSPALKNLIDIYGRQAFGNKPIAIATVSSGDFGGLRAALHLQHVVLSIGGKLFPQTLLTGNVGKLFDDGGESKTHEYAERVNKFIKGFVYAIDKTHA